jgi:hypothetical protein
MTTASPVVPDILEEHLEELAFLSLQRRKLLFDHETSADELAGHERRIEAHRAGLAIGGTASVDIARRRLEDAVMDWEIAAALRTWVELGSPTRIEIAEALGRAGEPPAEGTGEEDGLAGWREAFRSVPPARARELLPSDSAAGASVLADALGWHGALDVKLAATFACHESGGGRRGVARTLGAAPFDAAPLLSSLLEDSAAAVRSAALWSLALRDPAAAVGRARSRVAEADPFELRVIGLLGAAEDLRPLAGRARKSAAAVRAMGDLLDPRALGVLFELAAAGDEGLASAAADAVMMLTGIPEGADEAEGPDLETLRALAARKRTELEKAARWLRGFAFPPVEEEARTTEADWRLALAEASPDRGRRLREVPDGFFSGAPDEEARCGE